MLRLSITLILVLLGLLPIQAATSYIEVGGTIASDTTWSGPDTILVTNDVRVSSDVELTIEPGTVIHFVSGLGLIVNGSLQANGTAEAPIQFSSASDTLGGAPNVWSWEGIRVNGPAVSQFHHSQIRYASYCVQVYDAAVEFHSCLIENFFLRGIYIYGSTYEHKTVLIEDCTIRQTAADAIGTGLGIYILKTGAAEIRRSTIQDCSQGIEIFGLKNYQPLFTIENCQIEDNSANGVYIHTGT